MSTLRLSTNLPNLTAATVRRWLISLGQSAAKGQLLVELETENQLIHIEAHEALSLTQVLAPVGRTLTPGSELATIGPASAGSPVITTATSTTAASPSSITATHTASSASPSASTSTPSPSPVPASTMNSSTPSQAASAGLTPILMPQAGNTMEEGRILSWKVSVGDTLKLGQIIAEIETDKATMEFESPVEGKLAAIVVPAGEAIAVKQPIAYVGEGSMSGLASTSSSSTPSPVAATNASSSATTTAAADAIPASALPILMPQAGNTMEEGRILSWKVSVGDTIKLGQIIAEIETDKATMEFESPLEGKLAAIVVPAGEVMAVKQPIAYLNDTPFTLTGSSTSPASASPASPAPSPAPSSTLTPTASANSTTTATFAHSTSTVMTSSTASRVPASPAARKLAAQHNLNLSTLAPGLGSGPQGRILSTDVLTLAAHAPVVAKVNTPAPSASTTSTASASPALAPAAPLVMLPADSAPIRRPMSKMRKAIATNLQKSKQTVPHFYVRMTIHADPLFSTHKQLKPTTGCSINDLIALAVAKTMIGFPAFRSRLDGDTIVEYPTANLGIAVGIDDGLVVPVIMAVDRMTIAQLASESKRIIDSARKGRPENMGKGVFTLSNLGMFGVEEFAAIINPPESGILAISAVRESVLVKDGAIRTARVMTMTLSCDHRIVDGLLAAQYLAKLKENLENPMVVVG